MKLLKEELQRDQTLEVDQETLNRIGADYIFSRPSAGEPEFRQLFEELHQEKIGHTWKKYPLLDIGNLANVISEENKKRPTQFFFFYAQKGNQASLMGAATIAESICNSFQYKGLPVLSRCYIRRAYRNNRLYTPMLVRRIEYCEQMYGDELKAIHLGTSNIRVLKSALSNAFQNFKLVGNEVLDCGKYREIIFDFLRFSPSYQESCMTRLPEIDPLLGDYFKKVLNNSLSSAEAMAFKEKLKIHSDQPIAAELSCLLDKIGITQIDESLIEQDLKDIIFAHRED